MADFLRHLPSPQVPSALSPANSTSLIDPSLAAFSVSSSALNVKTVDTLKKIPPYGRRQRWYPKGPADFGDGGAYPEIHIAQYPLDMGRAKSTGGKTVALQMGVDGKLQYDAIVKQNKERIAHYTKLSDQLPLYARADALTRPDEAAENENLEATKKALDQTLNSAIASTHVVAPPKKDAEYFKYTPNKDAPGHNANCSQRVIRMVEKPTDPLEVAKFKHKRVPAAPPSPPSVIQHSPPRKLTAKDQQEWKIPPSVSNWKNQKGYTIPLDKRIQADGRGLQEITINDKFAALSESLYIAERSAREEIRIRNEMLKQKKAKEEELREQQLRELAAKARAERSTLMKQKEETVEDSIARQQRDQIEKERKRELERELRLQRAGKRSKILREGDRDISERIALGQPQPTAQEVSYDARLFNQTGGLDTGFDAGNDESYAIYDKPLFADRAAAGIYQYSKERFQKNVGGKAMPSFAGTTGSTTERTAPVEFEKDKDPFGLDNLLSEAKRNAPR